VRHEKTLSSDPKSDANKTRDKRRRQRDKYELDWKMEKHRSPNADIFQQPGTQQRSFRV